MKIDPSNPSGNLKLENQGKRAAKAGSKIEFGKILEQEVSGMGTGLTGPGGIRACPGPASLGPIGLPGRPPAAEALDALDRTLEGLERYRRCLASAGTSLKEASALLEEVKGEVRSLQELSAARLLEPGLNDLVHEAMATVMAEEARFRRGDYC